MVRTPAIGSSSGQTPEIPQEKRLEKQKSTQYKVAIKKLGLEQREESKFFESTGSKKSIKAKISKPPKGGVALPIRPSTEEKSKPPSMFEESRSRRRTEPTSQRTIPAPSESAQAPARPPRKTAAPPPIIEIGKPDSEDSEDEEEFGLPARMDDRLLRFVTPSEDQARQIVHDPERVRELSSSPEGRKELYSRGTRLLRSSVVGDREASEVLHTVIGVGTRALNESISGGAKITDDELAEEMALLQASIKKFERLEAREAIRYASQTRFENTEVDGEQIDQAVARYNEIKAVPNAVLQASITKMEQRNGIYQQISDLTGGNPIAWVNEHIPAGTDRRHALRFLHALQGSGTFNNSYAKPLRDALAREGLINREEKTALGHRISDARHSFTAYRADDLTLKREVYSLINQVNEMLIGERVFRTSLQAFLEPIYIPKDADGRKLKDEEGNVIKLNYFQALEMRGIITAEQSTYFQRHLHGVIVNSEKLFSQIGIIERADPNAEAGSPASFDAANLRQVLAALADQTTPDSLYELTQSMSKISERLPEFLKMIRDLQDEPAKDDLTKQFRAAERRLLPGKAPVGAENLYIAPTQRAMRYPMYFGEIEKSADRLGMAETLAFAQERIECLKKCSLWANYKI